MKILIINLPNSIDRLKFQEEQFQNLNMEFEILEAITVKDIDKNHIETLCLGWERPLKRTELACFFSHKKAWQYVYDTNLPTLILEDDALLSSHTKSLLNLIGDKNCFDFVTLEVRGRKKIIAKEETLKIQDNHKLYELYQDRTGAAAYILWPSGAKKLLDKANTSSAALADAFISSCYSLKSFQIEPAIAIQLDQCSYYNISNYNISNYNITKSTVSSKVKPKISNRRIIIQSTFKFRRVYSQIRMGIRHLSVLLKGNKRKIHIEPSQFLN